MRRLLIVLAMFIATPVSAADIVTASGAILRGLDKVDGNLTDIELGNGQSYEFGRLKITLNECRYPSGNPSGNAYANLTIRENGTDQPVFSGWMIATAPALNALDYARYDVWVLRCKTK
ncbi:MAG TPA: DUF2155 domain-containing protein [Rhodobacteraceae bacterium]|jgi:hypothetical protein|nr:DUF2155 domain-containing protein [Paracoccaceae bacterium]